MKHTDKVLADIYSSHKGDNIHAEYFIKHYQKTYEEFEETQDWEDENESVEDHALNYCLKYYLPIFLKYLKIGHGPIWSNEIAESVEDEPQAILDTYHKIKKENPVLAKSEIELYAESLSKDKLFIKYYLFLMNHDYLIDVEERAFNYVKIFNEQIALGKSEVYSHEYSDLMVSKIYTKIFCEAYAFSYDDSHKKNKSKKYSVLYADKFADYVANNYSELSETKEDEDFIFFHERIIGIMKAWEYTEINKTTNGNTFIDIYEAEHINTYFSENSNSEMTNEEKDSFVLKKTLEKFKNIEINNKI